MQRLKTFSNKTEAQLAQAFLASRGLPSEITGKNDYLTSLFNAGMGQFTLMVKEADLEPARQALLSVIGNDEASSPPDYFRKSVLLAFGAMFILPVIFNIFSLTNAVKFWRQSDKDLVAIVKIVLIVALQIPTLWIVMLMGETLTSMMSIFHDFNNF